MRGHAVCHHSKQKVGIPVKYVVCDDEGTVHELEMATRPWTIHDFLSSYTRIGASSYVEVKKYSEKTGITVSDAISLLAGQSGGSSNHNKRFKRGTYQVGDRTHADQVAEVVIACKKKKLKCATASLFGRAISHILRVEEIDRRRLIKKLAQPASIHKQQNLQAYLVAIEDVYNRQAPKSERLPLAFLA